MRDSCCSGHGLEGFYLWKKGQRFLGVEGANEFCLSPCTGSLFYLNYTGIVYFGDEGRRDS